MVRITKGPVNKLELLVSQLERIGRTAKIFQSMPWIPGMTPRYLQAGPGVTIVPSKKDRLERHYGVFDPDVACISPFDHGWLYGDGVFEGTRFIEGRALFHKEHLDRLFHSGEGEKLIPPHALQEVAQFTLDTIGESGLEDGYVRTLWTRGIGDLGINPAKSPEPTLTIIVSTIQLYPAEVYERGLDVSVARRTRRSDAQTADPGVKSLNYRNNIHGLLETATEGTKETIMLTPTGNIAEATADNLFIVNRLPGWERDPSNVVVTAPAAHYALPGITRAWVLQHCEKLGYAVRERDDLYLHDLFREDTEVFLTGTGAMLVPVRSADGISIGSGGIGPVTNKLLTDYRAVMRDPHNSVSVNASPEALREYLHLPSLITVGNR